MNRTIYSKLLDWKRKSAGKTAVMLDGARRVGKSWIAETFARQEYEHHLLIDFATASPKVKRYFNECLDDLDRFFMLLFAAYHVDQLPRGSLIIFDEVQRFPRAREAIKYLVADGRYHYLETGSLISINRNVRDILIPSEERHFKMYPLDWWEFMEATGRSAQIPLVREGFVRREKLDDDLHRDLMAGFREYLVVGGMPQAVAEFVDSHDLGRVDAIKRDILDLYRGDILKFAGAQKYKVLAIFNSIPAQLTRHERRFSFAELGANARMRNCEAAFEWLKGAMTVNVCLNAGEPNVGLELSANHAMLKCYLGDTGLLVSQAFAESDLRREAVHDRILSERLEVNAGMLVENVVAQMLRAAGQELYFHSNSDRHDAANRMEIDFLIDKPDLTRRHNIVPIEVKSARSYSTVSLDKFRNKYAQQLSMPYVLHTKNLEVKNGVVYLPLYMTPFIATGAEEP